MNHNDFGGAVIPAMAGFLFWKRAKVQEIRLEPVQQLPAVISTGSNGLTGVAKYIATLPLVTGVAKYVKKQEKEQVSGVTKYLIKQAIAEKNAPSATGVAKYLANASRGEEKRKKSGVDKYLLKLDFAAKQQATLTGVAKYQAEQDLIERKKAAAALVERYREEEKRAAIAAKEAAQMSYENAVQCDQEDIEKTASTGLGRYLQNQAKQSRHSAKPTGVAKYIARQIVLDSQKPALSGVGKYLRNQSASASKKPALTGVAKYLSRQPQTPATERKQQLPPSGVTKYLASQEQSGANKPVLSGVAKYLDKQSRLAQDKPALALVHQTEVAEQAEKCLEGEFIPANQSDLPLTGVARYLDKQNSAPAVSNAVDIGAVVDGAKQPTGVSRYLERNAGNVKQAFDFAPENLSGVDRYLLRRA